ncbi:hypothetical protein SAMN04487820_110248 [Actinopolyspora mzabensis]|uniref:DivIVA protein n=1 Tax=Actinopolyspora mzabensis TaxID=995066 RepID=A0A1G9DQW7_ACTMZ|nr:hypothetical protein [Actinopolyspora mzabensis]SDK66272.1 hypothetical protein SAMN04487820_110248 [Actinopolyspora mzabensis]
MEDAADAVVPLRPGFDVQFRGFQREQVLEHLEVLENQLELVTIDRNESARLNSDLRELYDRTRQELTETQQRLHHVESSETGLPAASQRVQEMLALAEEELRTIREQAGHEAEVIRGSAESEANRLIEQAEETSGELHGQCERLLAEIERRHERLHRDRARQLNELREREQRMRRSVRDAYKSLMNAARRDAAELVERTRRECGKQEAEAERHRRETLEEITRHRTELESLRDHVLNTLDTASNTIGASAVSLRRAPEKDEAPTPEETGQQGTARHESASGREEREAAETDEEPNVTRFVTSPTSIPVQVTPILPETEDGTPEPTSGTDGSAPKTSVMAGAPAPRGGEQERPREQPDAVVPPEEGITTVTGTASGSLEEQDPAGRN